jgi:hypothetical protein
MLDKFFNNLSILTLLIARHKVILYFSWKRLKDIIMKRNEWILADFMPIFIIF